MNAFYCCGETDIVDTAFVGIDSTLTDMECMLKSYTLFLILMHMLSCLTITIFDFDNTDGQNGNWKLMEIGWKFLHQRVYIYKNN
ncbi:hypothetical protein BpHYR1_030055 [Brachionus plicatilis]|uniref:Uncharacterized protein n=1 Tax=Brachionus plicatilis TaxID=10195 RepID=A0A3M7SLP6_BRAPC|nr:hypothetical protein BpHYR1_030055 [Brachionus plicatilis]